MMCQIYTNNRKKARKAVKRLKTIAGHLLREIRRQMSEEQRQRHRLALYRRVLKQKCKDKNKIYFLHEPHVYCMSKSKEHKKYEFGTKASLAKTRDSNVLIGTRSFETNLYDGHTLEDITAQVKRVIKTVPHIGLCDRGYRGKSKINGTLIMTPKPARKNARKETIEQTEFEKILLAHGIKAKKVEK